MEGVNEKNGSQASVGHANGTSARNGSKFLEASLRFFSVIVRLSCKSRFVGGSALLGAEPVLREKVAYRQIDFGSLLRRKPAVLTSRNGHQLIGDIDLG